MAVPSVSPYSISFVEKAWRFSERRETGSGAWTKQKYKAMEMLNFYSLINDQGWRCTDGVSGQVRGGVNGGAGPGDAARQVGVARLSSASAMATGLLMLCV